MRIYFNSIKFVEVVMLLNLGIGMYDYHQAAASHTEMIMSLSLTPNVILVIFATVLRP